MFIQLPQHIVIGNRGLNRSGSGRAPGSHLYVDAGRGSVTEIFVAQVIQTGQHYSLARVADNPALPLVRIDHPVLNGSGPSQAGQLLLVALDFGHAAGPRASWAESLRERRDFAAHGELTGTITLLRAGHGFIRQSTGGNVFFPFAEARGFAPAVGMSVRFRVQSGPRGPVAVNVRRA
jgi:cold shock CspA family protein